eukprot:g2304.t1
MIEVRKGSIVYDVTNRGGDHGFCEDRPLIVTKTSSGVFQMKKHRSGSVTVSHDSDKYFCDDESFESAASSVDRDTDDIDSCEKKDDPEAWVVEALETTQQELSSLMKTLKSTHGECDRMLESRNKKQNRFATTLRSVHVNRSGSVDIMPVRAVRTLSGDDGDDKRKNDDALPPPPPPPPPPPTTTPSSPPVSSLSSLEVPTSVPVTTPSSSSSSAPSLFGRNLQDPSQPSCRMSGYVSRMPSILVVLVRLIRGLTAPAPKSDGSGGCFEADVGFVKKRKGRAALEATMRRYRNDADLVVRNVLHSSADLDGTHTILADREVACALLKSFLAKLPTRLLTCFGGARELEHYVVVDRGAKRAADEKKSCDLTHRIRVDYSEIRRVVSRVCEPHRSSLDFVLALLRDSAKASNDPRALCVAMAPFLFNSLVGHVDSESLQRHMRAASIASKVLEVLLDVLPDGADPADETNVDMTRARSTGGRSPSPTTRITRMSPSEISARLHRPSMTPVLRSLSSEALQNTMERTGVLAPEPPSPRTFLRDANSDGGDGCDPVKRLNAELVEIRQELWWARQTRDWIWRGKMLPADSLATTKRRDPELHRLLTLGVASRSPENRWDETLASEAEQVAFDAFITHLNTHENRQREGGRAAGVPLV